MEPIAKWASKPVFEHPAKTVINFESAFDKKLLCDGPTFSAGTSCVYSCTFCYVPAIMRKSPVVQDIKREHGKNHDEVVLRREHAIETLRKQLFTKKGRELAHEPLVIYSSPLVDVAANMTLVRETIEMCEEILCNTDWDIRMLSKSNLLPFVARGIRPAFKSRVIYGVSTGTLDDKIAAAIEVDTPLVSKRIESLHWLQDNGYRTFGMICPSLPMSQRNNTIHKYAEWSREITAAIRVDKCEHVWAEVINARGDSFQKTFNALYLAGYADIANALADVSQNKDAWEDYARWTFLGHTENVPGKKLRFLQYVTNDTRAWWEGQRANGAVLL